MFCILGVQTLVYTGETVLSDTFTGRICFSNILFFPLSHPVGPQSFTATWKCFSPSLCHSKQHAQCSTVTLQEPQSNNPAIQLPKLSRVGNMSRLTWFQVIKYVWRVVRCTKELFVINHSAHKLQQQTEIFCFTLNEIKIYMRWCSNINIVVHCHCNLTCDLNVGSTSWGMKFRNIENFHYSFFLCQITDWQISEFAILYRQYEKVPSQVKSDVFKFSMSSNVLNFYPFSNVFRDNLRY